MSKNLNLRFHDTPMLALLAAQFLSALADNALLVTAVAEMKLLGAVNRISWVQIGFILPYILLAPYVGRVADALPKGRVLMIGNSIKLAGTLLMMAGIDPVASYLIVGVGATLYSPAKYGILSQMFHPEHLVRANALLESSTIAAILLGVVAGGWLSDWSVIKAMQIIAGLYLFAALVNLLIPRLPPQALHPALQPLTALKVFGHAIGTLLRDPAARISLIGTSLFWGCGAALRLMLFVWVPQALHITNNRTPADMMGILSLGIVMGAALAWFWVSLTRIHRAFLGGMLIGPAIIILDFQHHLLPADICLWLMGMAGGLFIVPLNALLQTRGQNNIGVGQVLSVQNFLENISMLLLVGAYGLSSHLAIDHVVLAFGVLMLVGMSILARQMQHLRPIKK